MIEVKELTVRDRGEISLDRVSFKWKNGLIYGVLGDVFPLYMVFAAGTAISLLPMLYMCFHPKTREFVLEH